MSNYPDQDEIKALFGCEYDLHNLESYQTSVACTIESKNDNPTDTLNKEERKYFEEKYEILDKIEYFRPVLKCINKIFEMGANKYGPYNWELTNDVKYSSTIYCSYNAVLRHLLMILTKTYEDRESKLPHIYHAACRTLMMCVKYLIDNFNNTYKNDNNLVGTHKKCLLPDTDLNYIPGIFLISLMKFNKIDKKHIDKYKELEKDELNSEDLLIITARYLVSLMIPYEKNVKYVNIYNEVSKEEELCLNILTIINELLLYMEYEYTK